MGERDSQSPEVSSTRVDKPEAASRTAQTRVQRQAAESARENKHKWTPAWIARRACAGIIAVGLVGGGIYAYKLKADQADSAQQKSDITTSLSNMNFGSTVHINEVVVDNTPNGKPVVVVSSLNDSTCVWSFEYLKHPKQAPTFGQEITDALQKHKKTLELAAPQDVANALQQYCTGSQDTAPINH